VRREGEPGSGSETSPRTFNYGGGARWFNVDHIAFTLDVRIYALNPSANEAGTIVVPRATVVVLNVGVAFR
jgi:hypothetical protein